MGVGTNGFCGRHIRIHEPETTSGGLWSPDVTKQAESVPPLQHSLLPELQRLLNLAV
jgi:hypothetical protein